MAAGTSLCTGRRDQLCRTGIKFEPVTLLERLRVSCHVCTTPNPLPPDLCVSERDAGGDLSFAVFLSCFVSL